MSALDNAITITMDNGYTSTADKAFEELEVLRTWIDEKDSCIDDLRSKIEQLAQDGYRLTQKLAQAQVQNEEARRLILHFKSGGGYMPNLCEVCEDCNTWLEDDKRDASEWHDDPDLEEITT